MVLKEHLPWYTQLAVASSVGLTIGVVASLLHRYRMVIVKALRLKPHAN